MLQVFPQLAIIQTRTRRPQSTHERRDAEQRRSPHRIHEAIRIRRGDHPEGQVRHQDSQRGHRGSGRARDARRR